MSTGALQAFSHEALFYDGLDELVERTVPFVHDGVGEGEPVMVALTPGKLGALRDALGGDAAHVRFVDMAELGGNPARIIPAWREFMERRQPGRGMRGIGEPIWAGRTPDELVECQLHEALLNIAFADADGFRLLCPYDVGSLPPGVIREACGSHPVLTGDDDRRCPSREYRGLAGVVAPFEVELPPPASACRVMSFDGRSFAEVRAFTRQAAADAGVADQRVEDLLLAVHEVATNSVRHGGGKGVLRAWRDGGAVVCEIRDRGRIGDPLVGRRVPSEWALGGRGVWLANQLCDLVQIRSLSTGTVVRLRMTSRAQPAQ